MALPVAPVPPIELGVPAEAARPRFGPVVEELDAAFLDALGRTGAEVRTAAAERAEAGRDWWPLTLRWALAGQVPAYPSAVVRPRSAAQVAAVLRACSERGVPVTATGGRSGVCGAALAVFGGVALDLTAMAGLVAVDDESLLVDVAPGTNGAALEEELRARGLTLGHWPQSIAISTVGGWVACRSAGQYSTRYGKIEDMVAGLEVALADGRLVRTGGAGPRAAVGPDLTQAFVGSEGTLGVVTEARLRVRPLPPVERRAAYGFPGFAAGLDACRVALRRGATPAVLRLYDATESQRNFGVPGRCVLVVLDEAEVPLVEATMALVDEACAGAERLGPELVASWLEHRNDTSALQKWTRRGIVVDTVEVAARWSALPALYEAAVAAVAALPATVAVSAHQSHAYPDGACLYFSFAGAPEGDEAAEAYYRGAWDAVTRATLAAGGALSHHHGVGLNRGRYVAEALGPAFDVLAALKAALDPAGVLNPGKFGLPSPFGPPPWP